MFKDLLIDETHNLRLCESEEVQQDGQDLLQWINSPEFRSSFHVNEKAGEWKDINENVFQLYKPNLEGSVWIYDVFYLLGYRMMHIFGDADAIITLPGLWKTLKQR